ncbi:MAG: DUF393 domain-containing protein [Alphaproteobacteria bacterium]|nr:DUF393 domain-containing protein [Alphaproteobacteria bacterium]
MMTETPVTYSSPDLTVFYDGSCPLCCREIAVYRRRVASVRTRWTDVSACTPEALPEGLTRQDALARFHVQRADGALISGAGAFAELWAHTPGFRWLGFMARLPLIRGVLDRAYGIFLCWRPVLQQLLSRSRET